MVYLLERLVGPENRGEKSDARKKGGVSGKGGPHQLKKLKMAL